MPDGTRLSGREAGTQSEADVATRPLRILVVDDEPNICALFAEALLGQDYVVRTCTTGEEAIQAAAAEVFDVVFIDVMMPGINGLQVLRSVRERLPGATFIMITGYPDSRLVDGSLASGAFVCLSKPVSLDDVLRLLEGLSEEEPRRGRAGSSAH